MKLSEFRVQGLVATDFTIDDDYYDADGDGAANPAFTIGGLSHKWFDGNGVEITDENKMVGCSGFRQPLTLKINLAAQSHSRYGNPRDSDPAGLEQSYQIKTTSGICYARPNQMNVYPQKAWIGKNKRGGWTWNGSNSTVDPAYGGGYSSDFVVISNSVSSSGIVNVTDGGFKPNASRNFPTTGFPKASFNLVVTGSPSDWTFSSNGGSAVTVNSNGKVTLNSKPSGAVTITATENATGQGHSYTFNLALWVVPKGNMLYANAKTTCGGAYKIPSRAQLTNSAGRRMTSSNYQFTNGYTRKVDGSVFGEWGFIDSTTYPGSQWDSSAQYYWTRDARSPDEQFIVGSGYGNVISGAVGNAYSYAVCLG
ncbi:Ig-like domain-containing protein [Orbaceae bacterium ac157xtp]